MFDLTKLIDAMELLSARLEWKLDRIITLLEGIGTVDE